MKENVYPEPSLQSFYLPLRALILNLDCQVT